MKIWKVALAVALFMISGFLSSCSVGSQSSGSTDAGPSSSPIISAASSSSALNNETGWSYQGHFHVSYTDPGTHVTGFEFVLQYDGSSGEYTAQPKIGDCDKIDYYILTDHSITIAVNKKYAVESQQGAVNAHVMINLIQGGKGEYSDEYGKAHGEVTAYTMQEDDQLISLEFGKSYGKGQIRDLLFIWGNIE